MSLKKKEEQWWRSGRSQESQPAHVAAQWNCTGMAERGRGGYFTLAAMIGGFTLRLLDSVGDAAIAGVRSQRQWNSCGPLSRLSKQAEAEGLWQTRHLSFTQVKKELAINYSTMRRLLDREIGLDIPSFIDEEEELFLGIDEHNFRHQDLVYTVTEVK